MKIRNICLVLLVLAFGLAGCQQDFLDKKPVKSLLVPETAADMQALLDNPQVFNFSPALTGIADGDLVTTEAGYNAFNLDAERNSFTWAKDIYAGVPPLDWSRPWEQVLYANVVLEALGQPAAQKDSLPVRERLRGAALFYRSLAFFDLVQQFAVPYQAATAATDLGIPLRLSPDVTQRPSRSTVAASYAQILSDLRTARALLPGTVAYKSRPSVAVAQALLARVYLAMGDYPRAGAYADSCLQVNGVLIDYNTLSTTAARPFPRALPYGNEEVIFYSVSIAYSFVGNTNPTGTDPALVAQYAADDLRKVIFFRTQPDGSFKFKGNYAGISTLFSGMANDELYLIRAECRARQGDVSGAMADLNVLLEKRWKAGTFVPFTAADAGAALRVVLEERRKELTGRGLRWADLRRLNSDPRFAVTLERNLGGNMYSLAPNSPRYTYPIPDEEVRLSGLIQNER